MVIHPAQLPTQNIFPGKNRMKNCPLGGLQSWTVRFENKFVTGTPLIYEATFNFCEYHHGI